MRFVVVVFVVMMFAIPCQAQDNPVIQGKFVTHATVPADPGWYPTGWVITNVRENASDNINFISGVGRKLENGWVEFMLQTQHFKGGQQWFFDFRLQKRLNARMNVFMEASPFIGKAALYDFVRVEYRLGPINLVAESENIHKDGSDSLGIGPGISIPPMKLIGRLKFAPVIVWQLRPNDPSFVRFYFGFPF